ncbi:mismatch repair protein, putative [Bodo saltans]|uniref:Mismatch repair protein, putative n=1 Tax=Bodo saltans TaxID=75058 RepID=A0A0S4IUE1_BODSA|nr:mismatch repair protein, putative [Bodo saltans]|eukprot:CUF91770.1 mismatch repair protein, putative [Bodo saltans]
MQLMSESSSSTRHHAGNVHDVSGGGATGSMNPTSSADDPSAPTFTSGATEILHTDHYLCTAASNALLSFVESTNGVLWMAGAVSIRFKALDGLVQLDRGTAKGLKVISAVAAPHGQGRRDIAVSLSGSGTHQPHCSAGAASLAEALDFTQTLGGRRLLRRNVLQPLRDATAIHFRQDVVEFLISNRPAYVAFRNQLRRISFPLDLDTVVAAFSSVPASPVTRTSTVYVQRCVSHLVSLRQVIVVVQSIVESLRRFTTTTTTTSTGVSPQGNEQKTFACPDEVTSLPWWKRGRDGGIDDGGSARVREDHDDAPSSVPKLLCSIFKTLDASTLEPLRNHLDVHLDEDIISGRALTGTGQSLANASDALDYLGEEVTRRPQQQTTNRTVARRSAYQRPQGVALQVQQCFAIRPTVSSALDVARESYASLMEAVFQHVDSLRDAHHIPSLKLRFDTQRQLFLVYDAQHDGLAIPDVFLRKYHPPRGRSMTCTTHELTSLKASIAEVLDEIATGQREIVEHLTGKVRESMPTLQAVCDAISLLDMMVSFTSFSIANRGVRPELVTYGPLVSHGCQLVHLVNTLSLPGTTVPSPVHISAESPVVVLGGPNASGKSTLLRVIGHAAIVAHIGCFVPVITNPASGGHGQQDPRPVFRLLDRLVALVPERDDSLGAANGIMESSFFHEMRSVAFATQVISRSSLVLVDEVGRGTSTSEGTCVARALVEWLADVRCLAVVATHLTGLIKIPDMLHRVQNQHMAVFVHPEPFSHRARAAGGGGGGVQKTTFAVTSRALQFPYVPLMGACTVNQYGIQLARQIGVDSRLLSHVPRILRALDTIENSTTPSRHLPCQSFYIQALLDAIEVNVNFHNPYVMELQQVLRGGEAAAEDDAMESAIRNIISDLCVNDQSSNIPTALPSHRSQLFNEATTHSASSVFGSLELIRRPD